MGPRWLGSAFLVLLWCLRAVWPSPPGGSLLLGWAPHGPTGSQQLGTGKGSSPWVRKQWGRNRACTHTRREKVFLKQTWLDFRPTLHK